MGRVMTNERVEENQFYIVPNTITSLSTFYYLRKCTLCLYISSFSSPTDFRNKQNFKFAEKLYFQK